MANYQEVRAKPTNTQLKKKNSAEKNKTGKIRRLFKKDLEDEEFPNESFLTTRQMTKIRNVFAKNMSTDIKLSKSQISKIIESGGSFGSWIGNLGKKAPRNITISLARDNLPGLASNLTSSTINLTEK